jgi:restriction system protein
MESEIYKQVGETMFKSLINGFATSLTNFWYIWTLLAVLGITRLALGFYHIYRLNKAGLPQIDKMSGPEFEDFLGQLFKRLGYKVELVGGMADYGADLIIEKNNTRTAVQAKCWNYPVNVKAIQEINTAKAHYNSTEALAVTNSRFTSNAITLANENHVQLVDRDKLAALILQKQ